MLFKKLNNQHRDISTPFVFTVGGGLTAKDHEHMQEGGSTLRKASDACSVFLTSTESDRLK